MRRAGFVIAASAILTASVAGCHSVKPLLRPDPGATGYAICGPYSVQRFLYPTPLVERAAIEAMTDMKLSNVKRTVKDDGVSLRGFLYDGRCVCMTIEREGQDNSVASLLIDFYGDEPMSKILLERTGIRLATLPQSVNPPFAPRAMTDSITHRGLDVEGYRGAPLR